MKHILTFTAVVLATSCVGQAPCQSDLDVNANGAVDIADFLHVLGLFGDVDSDGDGVWDSQDNCIDLESCNFMDSAASFCAYPDAIGDCNGNCPEDMNGDGVCDVYSCGEPVGYHGYDYETVLIGDQCWFAENLQSAFYSNGDPIPSELTNSEWEALESGASAVYGEESGSLAIFGRLYNWYAVNDGRGLCPTGWFVPSDEDWINLEVYLGMSQNDANALGWRGEVGFDLKEAEGWVGEGNGSNASGFSALPGGWRNDSGNFYSAGSQAVFWTSTQDNAWAFKRQLNSSYGSGESDGIYRHSLLVYQKNGFSVRCIQDSE